MEKYYKEIQEKIGKCYQNKSCWSVTVQVPTGSFDIADDIVQTYRKIGYRVHATPDNAVWIFLKKS